VDEVAQADEAELETMLWNIQARSAARAAGEPMASRQENEVHVAYRLRLMEIAIAKQTSDLKAVQSQMAVAVEVIERFVTSSSQSGTPAAPLSATRKQTTPSADLGTTSADLGTTSADPGTTSADLGTTSADLSTTSADLGVTSAATLSASSPMLIRPDRTPCRPGRSDGADPDRRERDRRVVQLIGRY